MSIPETFECSAVEIVKSNVAIICIYRVPNMRNLNDFFSRLHSVLQVATKRRYKNIVLAGDFNINVLKSNYQSLEFERILLNFNLKLAIYQPTRIRSHTCIDNFAHNFNKPCKTEIIEFALSDHTAQLIKCPTDKVCKIDKYYRFRRNYCQQNLLKFKSCLNAIKFSEIYNTLNPNMAYNSFIEDFQLFYNLCFPKVRVKVNIIKKTKWVSSGIKKCNKKKRQLLWLQRLKPNPENKSRFKSYSKLLKRIMFLTQRAQNDYKINNSRNKNKTTWQIINQAKLNLPKSLINRLKINDTIITNPIQISNEFNNYFIDKIQPKTTSLKTTPPILSTSKSMFMSPCVPQDILSIIHKLKNTNSVGYDGITTKVIKVVAHEISGHLCHIMNLCITSGIFPDALKQSIVKPVFKKQDRELMEYYRPISLIPIFSKIFEKFIHTQLYLYLEKNNLLCNEQNGFRKNKTLNLAIFNFLHEVMMKVDKRTPVCSIFCDMTQAFDYVKHDILIRKLDAYGVRGNVLKLFESYLENRKQRTEIAIINPTTKREELYLSDERKVLYGVPQGSVMGPLLFILYINDLPKCTKNTVTLFADDSTITISCNNDITQYKYDITNSLTSIINWLDINNLKINLNKTKIIHFSQRIAPISYIYQNINIDNHSIENVTTSKFLGLTIDKKLDWKSHIETLCKKLCSSAYALHTLTSIVNTETVMTAYYGLVASNLRYGIIFWGNSTDTLIAFKCQKRCIRSMFKLKTSDSCKTYFQRYKVLTLPSIYILEMSMFVKTNPGLFPRLEDTVTRNRRDNSRLRLLQAKTVLMRRSVFCMAPVIYNHLPQQWKNLSISAFKSKLKEFLEMKAYYSVTEFLTEKI